jgi:hypothetical protein
MPDNGIPKQLFFGELTTGKRAVGGQTKRYKDVLKSNLLRDLGVARKDVSSMTVQDQSRVQVSGNISHFVGRGQVDRRKARTASATTSDSDYQFVHCGHFFRARIDHISHLWTHRTQSTA